MDREDDERDAEGLVQCESPEDEAWDNADEVPEPDEPPTEEPGYGCGV